jgi:hypothetical protein
MPRMMEAGSTFLSGLWVIRVICVIRGQKDFKKKLDSLLRSVIERIHAPSRT